MKKCFKYSVAAALGLAICLGTSLAQNKPASKATVQAGGISVLGSPLESSLALSDGFSTILSGSIKTAEQKDLIVGVSLECGLSTRTLVRSKGGNKDTSSAEGAVEIRVLIDGVEAAPGTVTFCRRNQEMSATFQGLIDGCLSVDETGNVVLDDACLAPEEVELVLETMSANAFNFIFSDASSDVHLIEVQARISLDSSVQEGEAEARATLGKGSMTVEEVRLAKGEEIELQ